MTDQTKPGQPKDKEEINQKPGTHHQNPQDRPNQGGANKDKHDQHNNTNPSHTKE